MGCIYGPLNIPAFTLASLMCGNVVVRNVKAEPSVSNALTKFFINPNLMCKKGNRIFAGLTSGRYLTLCWPGSLIVSVLAIFSEMDIVRTTIPQA